MAVTRDYRDWDPTDQLEPDVEAALAFLDQLTDQQNISGTVAKIDCYGVVEAELPLGSATLWLQVGDGWNRVIWTVPSGRSYEWEWRELRGPQQVRALVTGRGRERVSYVGKRRVSVELLLEGEKLAGSGAVLLPVLRRFGVPLEIREHPSCDRHRACRYEVDGAPVAPPHWPRSRAQRGSPMREEWRRAPKSVT